MAEFKLTYRELNSVVLVRGPLLINTDDYPELKGMTEDVAKEYIEANILTGIKNENGDDMNDILYEEEAAEEWGDPIGSDWIFDEK